MLWAVTKFKVQDTTPELTEALGAWRNHVAVAHKGVREVRCYRFNGRTNYNWLEGFEDFAAYHQLNQEVDDQCAEVMGAVMRHAIPGSIETQIWADGI